ncbi:MAG TPA: hypothetical protein ENI27_03235 [bacterium]|nr:hypothetical protein [bacterium]
MKYQKKPVVIEAWQLTEDNAKEIVMMICKDGELLAHLSREPDFAVGILTLKGIMHHASVGDWIIKGIKGEYYPCNPDIFAESYSPFKE